MDFKLSVVEPAEGGLDKNEDEDHDTDDRVVSGVGIVDLPLKLAQLVSSSFKTLIALRVKRKRKTDQPTCSNPPRYPHLTQHPKSQHRPSNKQHPAHHLHKGMRPERPPPLQRRHGDRAQREQDNEGHACQDAMDTALLHRRINSRVAEAWEAIYGAAESAGAIARAKAAELGQTRCGQSGYERKRQLSSAHQAGNS